MFDKLIESDTNAAGQNGRNKYFIVSTLVVGTLFLTAVVFSLYAANIDIGASDLEMVRMLAPEVIEKVDEPEPEPQRSAAEPARSDIKVAVRNTNMLNIAESPKIPDGVSVVKNTSRERPPSGRWTIDPNGAETDVSGPGGRSDGQGRSGSGPVGGNSGQMLEKVAEREDTPAPPPVKTGPPPTKSLGVINGRAINLPIPVYSAAAKHMGISGDVNVQVTIDEDGKVVSAKAVSGHQLLRGDAQRAALRATFSPTYLSNQKVKVTGVIVYKFKN